MALAPNFLRQINITEDDDGTEDDDDCKSQTETSVLIQRDCLLIGSRTKIRAASYLNPYLHTVIKRISTTQ